MRLTMKPDYVMMRLSILKKTFTNEQRKKKHFLVFDMIEKQNTFYEWATKKNHF